MAAMPVGLAIAPFAPPEEELLLAAAVALAAASGKLVPSTLWSMLAIASAADVCSDWIELTSPLSSAVYQLYVGKVVGGSDASDSRSRDVAVMGSRVDGLACSCETMSPGARARATSMLRKSEAVLTAA